MDKNKIVFLACPYSGDKIAIEQRMETFCHTVVKLQKDGLFVISPLFMHFILKYEPTFGNDWDSWGEYSIALLERADELYVLCLDGWKESTGVSAEIECAKKLGKTINFIMEP